jgi:RNA polymerase sigma-70 factor (ECF subfamily)
MNDPHSSSLPHAPAAGARARRPTATDSELLVAVAAGDAAAFGRLYERYARAVLGLALRRLGDPGRAEDAVQETFAAIWRAASTYRPERGPGAPWLFTVARNAMTNQWRAKADLPAELGDEPSPEPGPDESAERAWRSFCVHRALEVLRGEQRAVLELAYWQGLSQTEIADRLGLPLGTVKTRTRAGLARLAVALREDLQ